MDKEHFSRANAAPLKGGYYFWRHQAVLGAQTGYTGRWRSELSGEGSWALAENPRREEAYEAVPKAARALLVQLKVAAELGEPAAS